VSAFWNKVDYEKFHNGAFFCTWNHWWLSPGPYLQEHGWIQPVSLGGAISEIFGFRPDLQINFWGCACAPAASYITMDVRRFSQGGQNRHFHIDDDAMQIDVNKRFSLSTSQRCTMFMGVWRGSGQGPSVIPMNFSYYIFSKKFDFLFLVW